MLQIREHETAELSREALAPELGEWLWKHHGSVIEVDFPTPKTGDKWRLKAGGWVGHIPTPDGGGIRLEPKVQLANLFRMLEYAYRLKSIEFPDGLTDSNSLQEYFESLAHVLAKRVLDRIRRGIYRKYVEHDEDLQFIRGRIDIASRARAPWKLSHRCHFDDHTGDIDDNQILAWTLFGIARGGLRRHDVLRAVRRAYRAVVATASLEPHTAEACIGRVYHRLNEDYEPLHALCRFFLEHRGPTHESGERVMVPFLVDMARVFELFVAEWFAAHLPAPYEIRSQERVVVDKSARITFQIDLVIRNTATGRAVCVLDTKYKRHTTPENNDFFQIVSYANAQRCRRGVLVYPERTITPLNTDFRPYLIRTMAFVLDGDLEEAGRELLQELLDWIET